MLNKNEISTDQSNSKTTALNDSLPKIHKIDLKHMRKIPSNTIKHIYLHVSSEIQFSIPAMSFKTKECIICLSQISNEDCHFLHCGHFFHCHCFKQWEQTNTTCPICKKDSQGECLILDLSFSSLSSLDENSINTMNMLITDNQENDLLLFILIGICVLISLLKLTFLYKEIV